MKTNGKLNLTALALAALILFISLLSSTAIAALPNSPGIVNVKFTASPTSGYAPLTVNFYDQTTFGTGGVINNRYWDFGDGSTSEWWTGTGSSTINQNPTHIYSTPGEYEVKLIEGATFPTTSPDEGYYNDSYSTKVITVLKSATPMPPSNLVATFFEDSKGQPYISLDWKDNSNDENKFKIERSTNLNGPYQLINTVPSNTVYYADKVSSNKVYYYRICASNSFGDSGYSNIASADTHYPPPFLSPEKYTPIPAEKFDYPIEASQYIPGSYANRIFSPYINKGKGHLGEDINPLYPSNTKAFAGTPVKAIADGKIIFYGPRKGYGELVALVEHDLNKEYSFKITIPSKDGKGTLTYEKKTRYIISIYGHIRSRSIRDGTGNNLPWKIGDTIYKGQDIGYINDDIDNGDGVEHLHMGIFLGKNNGEWVGFGYNNKYYDYQQYAPFSQIIKQLPT